MSEVEVTTIYKTALREIRKNRHSYGETGKGLALDIFRSAASKIRAQYDTGKIPEKEYKELVTNLLLEVVKPLPQSESVNEEEDFLTVLSDAEKEMKRKYNISFR